MKNNINARKRLIFVVNILFVLIACSEYSSTTESVNTDTIIFSKIQEWRLDYISSISWSPDNVHFALAGADGDDENTPNLYMYDINSTEPLWTAITIGGGDVAFQPDGYAVAVPYYEGVEYFDAQTGKSSKRIDHDSKTSGNTCIGRDGIGFIEDGSKVVTLSTNWEFGTTIINILSVSSVQCFEKPIKDIGTSSDFELSNDGYLAIGFMNSSSDIPGVLEPQVHVWNTETLELICEFKGAPPTAFTLDGKIIASTNINDESKIDIWDAKTCSFLFTLPLQEKTSPFSMDFSPDGSILAIGSSQAFEIWDVSNKRLLFMSEKMPYRVSALAFSPNGRFLLSKTDKTSVDSQAITTLWGVEQ